MGSGVESGRRRVCLDRGTCRNGLGISERARCCVVQIPHTVLVVLLVPCRIAACILWLMLLMMTVTTEHFFKHAELSHRRSREDDCVEQGYEELHLGRFVEGSGYAVDLECYTDLFHEMKLTSDLRRRHGPRSRRECQDFATASRKLKIPSSEILGSIRD